MSDTERDELDGKEWFAEIMWDELPEDAKERLRESRSTATDVEREGADGK
ncbi:hypothetical protein [Halarchaeum nitratireducens]|uniref:Uncharacterized protein n=1 Tax=Halarchaeum nitratireducens TaxID=489913 RepID=A0A830G7P0_9EURY|nr:hypothetical protein [Halarchaeum nitratireducens]GGN08093.1 hypothetical protein GCM10009021_04270 [Halarchaeum nitratireducens]